METQQEFTHTATPEENAYIEAFHSILQREVTKRHEFNSFYGAKTICILALRWEAETGSAGEQPARTTLANGDDRARALDSAPAHHLSTLL